MNATEVLNTFLNILELHHCIKPEKIQICCKDGMKNLQSYLACEITERRKASLDTPYST